MKGGNDVRIGYAGTVSGYRRFARKELMRAAFMELSVSKDFRRIQRALDKAARQDKVRQLLTTAQGGAGA